MIEQVRELLKELGAGTMSSMAYDTAWVARLGDMDRELSNRALVWLATHQLPDGSWGASHPYNYFDRVVSTLSAMIALSKSGRRAMDRKQTERGVRALESMANDAKESLQSGTPTVGFDLIVPSLVTEAEKMGLIHKKTIHALEELKKRRDKKLARQSNQLIDKQTSTAVSAEMAGKDGPHLLDIDNLQEPNGSIGNSPAATAYFATQLRPGDEMAIEYLHFASNKDGGTCNLYPIDVMERNWVLWNLALVNEWDQDTLNLLQPHLDYLCKAWKPTKGLAFSRDYSVPDGLNTIMAYGLLDTFHYEIDPESMENFKADDHYRCYQLESYPSTEVNIQALLTLRKKGHPIEHPDVQRVLTYLDHARGKNHYWTDRWHCSPYFSTSHLVIACAGYQDNLAREAVDWILTTQNPDGSWGIFGPNAEETAYCLQALVCWERESGTHTGNVVQHGARWLKENINAHTHPLWVGKGLFRPDTIVRAALFSALILAEGIT